MFVNDYQVIHDIICLIQYNFNAFHIIFRITPAGSWIAAGSLTFRADGTTQGTFKRMLS